MNLVVVLRPVRDPAGFTVNRKAQKIFHNREGFILNPSDRNALESGLALAGAGGAVTAVAVGGAPAVDELRMARATGASRAICITDPAAVYLDPFNLATVLQHVVNWLGNVDLVLLGADVLDSDAAQVGPRLAAALGWPFADRAYQASVLTGGGLGLVVAAADGYRSIGIDLPAVASIAPDSNQPRFAPAGRIISMFSSLESVENLSLAELGVDPAALAATTAVRGESFPPERTLGQIVEGEDGLRQISEALRRVSNGPL